MATRFFALVRAAFFASLFISLWVWVIPRWIAAEKGITLQAQGGILPITLIVVGGAIALRCIWDFAWHGRGTPAPFDPPRQLVVIGLYRWVRNPMYLGMGLVMIGLALFLPQIRRELLLIIVLAWVAATVFIAAYEEPTLRRLFGASYEEYCRHVRRWIPRLTPFDKGSGAAVRSPGLE